MMPPAEPWRQLEDGSGPAAYVSVYLSDDLARYPVRHITRPGDNKSDPNLETGTYGLFSTCQVQMRNSVVRKGVRHLIFVTKHGGRGRKLTGYYRVGWYAPGPDDDYVLAADRLRFVDPVPIDGMDARRRDLLSAGRAYRGIADEVDAAHLVDFLDSLDDRTDRYLDEIDRLELLSAKYTGYRYPTWQRAEPWSWGDAATYLSPGDGGGGEPLKNSSPTGRWTCLQCEEETRNTARLKRCPRCGAIRTLRAVTEATDG